ncbi:DEAD/DEAH box helicase, partial [Niallia circulans]
EFEKIQQFLRFPELELKEEVDMFELPFTEGLSLFSDGEQGIIELDESMAELMQVMRNPERSDIEVPKHLQSILKEYQKTGFKWMKTLARYGFGGILADDMGLGKTLQSITFIASELPAIRTDNKPVLVVCPSSLTYNWLQEIMKFAPEIQAVVIDGAANDRKKLLDELDGMDVVITSYPLLRKDVKWYATHAFHTVFFDEAQAFKNAGTQTAKAVKQLHADNRFALTGTPVENSIEELWSLYYIVFPQLFRSLKEYANLTRKQIAQRIKPFLLRRLKEDVLMELPGKEEWEEAVDLLPDQKKLYGAYLAKLRHDTFKHLDKATLRKNRIRILAGLTRLRQICCHPALFVDGYNGKSAKLEQLLQLVDESKQAGRRVLIFSQFTKMLELIGRELAVRDMPFFYLDGNTPSSERVELCHRYNAGERDYFLISLKAGGTGLNLMSADTVILYDTWWNPAVEEQAADRAHRIGQENVVQVIKLMAKGTIEEKIHELQEKKRLLVDELINTEEAVLSSITEEELRSLLL